MRQRSAAHLLFFRITLEALLMACAVAGTLEARPYCKIKRADANSCWFSLQCYHDIGELPLPPDAATACANRSRYQVTLHSARRPSLQFGRLHPQLDSVSFLSDIVSLRASNNNLTQIPDAVLYRMPRLHSLHLHDNRIGNIPTGALDNLTALRSLDLSYNTICELQPDTFNNNTALERLYLANNNITIIHGYTFNTLSSLKILDLSRNSLLKLECDTFRGLATLERLLLDNNNIFLLNSALKHLHRLKHLHLRENRLHKVDVDEIPNFLQLQTLDVSNNTLSSIQPEVFSRQRASTILSTTSVPVAYSRLRENRLPELVVKILLSRNEIISLENATFDVGMSDSKSRYPRQNPVDYMDSIPTEIDLSKNKIVTIEFDAFKGIAKLVSLDLSSNQLEAFDVNTSNMDNLLMLYLQNNNIKTIDSKPFDNLRKVKTLDFSGNNIDFFEEHSFSTMRDLTILNLSNNILTSLNCSSLQKLSSLNVLDVSHNQLVHVSIDYVRFESLKKLSLCHNSISDLSNFRLDYLLELEYLDLSHNEIEELDRNALARLHALKQLDLSFNSIFKIEASAFSGIPLLRTLDLSDNNLTRLEYGTFGGLDKLEALDLSGNSIGQLESTVLFDLKSLSQLDVERNGLQAMDLNVWKGRRVPVSVSVGANRLSCTWVAAALGDAARDWSGARLVSTRPARGGAAAVGGIECEDDEASALEASPSVSFDDRLLVTNNRILDAILTQTAEIKKSLKLLSYSQKRARVVNI